jgi:hypothetical protein
MVGTPMSIDIWIAAMRHYPKPVIALIATYIRCIFWSIHLFRSLGHWYFRSITVYLVYIGLQNFIAIEIYRICAELSTSIEVYGILAYVYFVL